MVATFTYVLPYALSAREWAAVRAGIDAAVPASIPYEVWQHSDAFGTEVTVRAQCGDGADVLNLRIREAIVNC